MTMAASRYRLVSALSRRNVTISAQQRPRQRDKMYSWQIHSYGELDELKLSKKTRIPHITQPNQVLVKVEAASVNPLDVAMIGGYGSTALNLMRNIDNIEFPLTLGRDFCGKVVSKGLGVNKQIDYDATVWGVVPVHHQGCHAEYVIVDANMITKKPSNINVNEAASMLYTGLTAWSGLMYSAGLKLHKMTGLKALVLGAAGGVGNSAVQILHAGGAIVTATCASDAVPLVESLGANNVLDYSSPEFDQKLADYGRFDLVVDCAGLGSEYAVQKPIKFRNFVTFTTPVLKNFDNLGLVGGAFASAKNIICPNFQSLKNGGIITWAYFVPTAEGINYIRDLVESKLLRPVVEKVYKFDELPLAYKRVKDGHLRGKIVISIDIE